MVLDGMSRDISDVKAALDPRTEVVRRGQKQKDQIRTINT